MARVTGLGGIFYKVEDPERTARWYKETLGLGGDWGIHFGWKSEPNEDPFSLLSAFKASSDYFAPSDKPFMVNLRVDHLEGLLAELKDKGVEIIGTQYEDYGKFAWILDCDGVKLELWEQLGPAPSG